LVLQRIREGQAPLATATRFAGFWIRLVARMIDNTITSIAAYLFQIPMIVVLARMGKSATPDMPLFMGTAALAVLMAGDGLDPLMRDAVAAARRRAGELSG